MAIFWTQKITLKTGTLPLLWMSTDPLKSRCTFCPTNKIEMKPFRLQMTIAVYLPSTQKHHHRMIKMCALNSKHFELTWRPIDKKLAKRQKSLRRRHHLRKRLLRQLKISKTVGDHNKILILPRETPSRNSRTKEQPRKARRDNPRV